MQNHIPSNNNRNDMYCPHCKNHCSLHNPGCEKGAQYAQTQISTQNVPNNTPGSSLAETLFSLLWRCFHLMNRGHHHHPKGMHPGQDRILGIIAAHAPLSQRELLDLTQIRSASLSELLGKVESHGFISRTKDERDKRNVIINLTSQGQQVVEDKTNFQQKKATSLFASLSEEEQQQMIQLLTKLVNSWDAHDQGPRPHSHGHPHHPLHGHFRGHHHGGSPRGRYYFPWKHHE